MMCAKNIELKNWAKELFKRANDLLTRDEFAVWLSSVYGWMESRMDERDLEFFEEMLKKIIEARRKD